MTLPEGFNEWEHLQHTIKKAHNNTVKDFFSSQPDNDISVPKGSLKHACLIKDDDTSNMTIIRLWTFWVLCRKMRDNFEPYYGIPVASFDAEVKYKPQITCFFLEDSEDVKAGYSPIEGQQSIRLINETSNSLTNSKLEQIANRVKLAYANNNGYIWKKGKELYTYVDKPNGHRFKVLAKNQSDAVEIIKKNLDIAQDTYQDKLLKKNAAIDPSSAYPNIAKNQTILGQTYKEPRQRPVTDVRFLYASIKIHGLPKPIILVDNTGYWSEALIKNW